MMMRPEQLEARVKETGGERHTDAYVGAAELSVRELPDGSIRLFLTQYDNEDCECCREVTAGARVMPQHLDSLVDIFTGARDRAVALGKLSPEKVKP